MWSNNGAVVYSRGDFTGVAAEFSHGGEACEEGGTEVSGYNGASKSGGPEQGVVARGWGEGAEEVGVDVPEAGEEDGDGNTRDGLVFWWERGGGSDPSDYFFVDDEAGILDGLSSTWNKELGFNAVEFWFGVLWGRWELLDWRDHSDREALERGLRFGVYDEDREGSVA